MGLTGIAIVIGMAVASFFGPEFWERYYEKREKKRKARILAGLLRSK